MNDEERRSRAIQSDAKAEGEVAANLSAQDKRALDTAGRIAGNLIAAEDRFFRAERLADFRWNRWLRIGAAIFAVVFSLVIIGALYWITMCRSYDFARWDPWAQVVFVSGSFILTAALVGFLLKGVFNSAAADKEQSASFNKHEIRDSLREIIQEIISPGGD